MEDKMMYLFPAEMRKIWGSLEQKAADISEIRVRAGKPVIVVMNGTELFLGKQGGVVRNSGDAYCAEDKDLKMILDHNCQYSRYAFEEELRQGFLTVKGGHRIGMAGQVCLNERGEVKTIRQIGYLNIRVAHQVPGAARKVMRHVYRSDGTVKNTLIASPPGLGKTTLLRDMIRNLSDGTTEQPGLTVGVVDERSELAGSHSGQAQNQLGMRTDVMEGVDKPTGISMLLRSMAPRVIAVDEIGRQQDFKALEEASVCGCSIVATMHAGTMEEVRSRLQTAGNMKLFECIVLLQKGYRIAAIFDTEESV